jgi:hypothetical protein
VVSVLVLVVLVVLLQSVLGSVMPGTGRDCFDVGGVGGGVVYTMCIVCIGTSTNNRPVVPCVVVCE